MVPSGMGRSDRLTPRRYNGDLMFCFVDRTSRNQFILQFILR